jgi:hypothetical protein
VLCDNMTHILHYSSAHHAWRACPRHGRQYCSRCYALYAQDLFEGCCKFTYDACCCQAIAIE